MSRSLSHLLLLFLPFVCGRHENGSGILQNRTDWMQHNLTRWDPNKLSVGLNNVNSRNVIVDPIVRDRHFEIADPIAREIQHLSAEPIARDHQNVMADPIARELQRLNADPIARDHQIFNVDPLILNHSLDPHDWIHKNYTVVPTVNKLLNRDVDPTVRFSENHRVGLHQENHAVNSFTSVHENHAVDPFSKKPLNHYSDSPGSQQVTNKTASHEEHTFGSSIKKPLMNFVKSIFGVPKNLPVSPSVDFPQSHDIDTNVKTLPILGVDPTVRIPGKIKVEPVAMNHQNQSGNTNIIGFEIHDVKPNISVHVNHTFDPKVKMPLNYVTLPIARGPPKNSVAPAALNNKQNIAPPRFNVFELPSDIKPDISVHEDHTFDHKVKKPLNYATVPTARGPPKTTVVPVSHQQNIAPPRFNVFEFHSDVKKLEEIEPKVKKSEKYSDSSSGDVRPAVKKSLNYTIDSTVRVPHKSSVDPITLNHKNHSVKPKFNVFEIHNVNLSISLQENRTVDATVKKPLNLTSENIARIPQTHAIHDKKCDHQNHTAGSNHTKPKVHPAARHHHNHTVRLTVRKPHNHTKHQPSDAVTVHPTITLYSFAVLISFGWMARF